MSDIVFGLFGERVVKQYFRKKLYKICGGLAWVISSVFSPITIYKLAGILPVKRISGEQYPLISYKAAPPAVWQKPVSRQTQARFLTPTPTSHVMNHLIEIKQGIACQLGFVFTEAGYLIANASHKQGPNPSGKHTKLQRQKFLFFDPPHRTFPFVNRTVAVLTASTQNTYFHWLFEVLPRLNMLATMGINPEQIYLSYQQPFQRETLEILGVTADDYIINCDTVPLIQAATLFVPCHEIQNGREFPQWVCRFLRESFLPQAIKGKPSKGHRIFISRLTGWHRRLINEHEIMGLLKNYGFQSVRLEELPFLDQVTLFRDAEIVIGSHGGGLSNLIFSRPGTRVIELFPAVGMDLYWRLCDAVGLEYYPLNAREGDSSRCGPEDYAISLEDFQKILKRAKVAACA